MNYKSFHSLQFNDVKLSTYVMSVTILLSALVLPGCSEKTPQAAAPAPPVLPVASIITGTETTFQDYPASIEGTVNVEIRPQVSGSLEKVYVDEGAFVNTGQPIFKINEQPYRAALNNALAAQHSAEASLVNAQLEVERLTPLVQNKVISEFQLKSAKATAQAAKANIEQAKANVATASINLGYTLIKAPVSGYIGRLLKKQGSLVAASDVEALTNLSDVHDVHVYFALGEKDFVNFKDQYPGQTLNEKIKQLPAVKLILADNTEYVRSGKIDVIDGQFDKTTGAITVRAKFPNPDGLLRSGNTGKIRLSLQHNEALVVPQVATIEVQDKVFVFAVADSNKVRKQAITIIGKAGNNYLVKDGVKVGDQIVLSGLDRLQEGLVIAPQKATDKVVAITKNNK
ncbi:efflux RND transporter periplasmic adaptor subunit [Pedobacter nyackensis]|uniref:efflux RND transporter periplasmic adaptor subunit n=1 Tax=Pedobacter nyackensis TaxID=475255 RepID=UPI0029305037|nr:efflux RND transporter periplasmic adaptor subunit [Pedobacter nyackensis]